MYKYLLTGCAAAALTFAASAASAQDFKVTLSGDAQFQASFAGQKKDAGTRATDFRSRFRLWVNPEAKGLDGALTYGAKVRVRFQDNDKGANYDRAFTYLKGAFGTVSLGTITTYNDDFYVSRPASWHTEDDVWTSVVGASQDTAYTTASASKLEAFRLKTNTLGGGTSNRVRYESPFIYGLQLGLSYTPYGDGAGWDYQRSSTAAKPLDAYEVGLYFNSKDKSIADKFGAALLQASFAYQGADNGDSTKTDYSYYQAGVNVGYQDFVIGGMLNYQGDSNLSKADQKKVNTYGWAVGAQYSISAVTFGVGYNYAQKDNGSTGVDGYKKSSEAVSLGVKYAVSKGLDVFADYSYVTNKNTLSNLKDNANVVTLSTKIGF